VFANFYHLSGLPFLLTPDTRFFYGSSGHSRAISHLVYGLSQQEGFIVITGEVGSGKTTLVEQLWAQLDRKTYVIARVVTTQVSGDDLLRLVMANFGLGDTPGTDKSTLLRRFEHMVRDQRKQGRRCLLVIDEVQNLSVPALEELRMLSNLTVDGKASLQTILLGQPQFRPIMASPDLDQLRQRVLASFHLGPLTEAETRHYIEHRMRTVDWQGDPAFEESAFVAIHQHSGGIPRRINTLCSRVLLLGALEESHTITAAMVDTTAEELNRDLGAELTPGRPHAGANVANGYHPNDRSRGDDSLDELTRRVETLERHAFRQDQAFRRVLDLLEANATGRS
jgi:putative secretion ATPase (PEP-CTERM system associated)